MTEKMGIELSVSGRQRLNVNRIIQGDCLSVLKGFPDGCVQCCVTSPPYYGLRDYGVDGQIGREPTPGEYIAHLTEIFREVRRVLVSDGVCWLNISDSYCGTGSKGRHADPKNPNGRSGQKQSLTMRVAGCKPKDMIGIPWMLAFALRADGWYLRSDVIWVKGNAMPETVQDRPVHCYEHIFLLTKSRRYYYDAQSVMEPAVSVRGVRSRRDVWQINTVPYKGGHYAAFPPKLAETCILAGCPESGLVLDPFFGTGTTGFAALRLNRAYIGIELNGDYCQLAQARIMGGKKGGDPTL